LASNLQVLLDHSPTEKVSPANFRVVETPVAPPGPGEVLVRHTFLSLDPYMRGRLSDAKSYAKPQELGAVMGGGTVGIVEASNNPRFHPGAGTGVSTTRKLAGETLSVGRWSSRTCGLLAKATSCLA
jgi:NADPH-dependent curcumin reductase CurA